MGPWPSEAPAEAENVTLRFEAGRPVEIDGQRVRLEEVFARANGVAGRHSVGIGLHLVENRFVGVKSRGIYEAPAMELLGTAYAYLAQITFDRRTVELFDTLSGFLAKQLYQGYWEDLASQMARAAIARSARLVDGTITLQLYRGNIRFVAAADVKHSLFNDAGSMEAGGSFAHTDSEGLVRILTLNAKTLARAGQL
jgi:argininosuccinate synthase